MTANDFRRIALALDGAIEGAHMGHADFRVNGRVFASLTADNSRGMVKILPEQQAELLDAMPAAFEPASGSWGLQGCTMVQLSAVDPEIIGGALTMAWRLGIAKPPSASRSKRTASKSRRAATKSTRAAKPTKRRTSPARGTRPTKR